MLPGIDTGGGGFSGSSGASGGADAQVGPNTSTFGGGLFNKSGIQFGSKGVNPFLIAGMIAAAAGAFIYIKKG